jgi:two-component system phosphate regulon response regulator PhoB
MTPARTTTLVVEDDPATCGVIQDLLESAGYVVQTAPDGATALEYMAAGGIDILVLDQMLPLLHGLELCRLIRGRSSDRYLPIIMVTALSGEPHRRNAIASGVDVYLTKPFDVDELVYVVDRWDEVCRRKRAQREGLISLMPEDSPVRQ